jgi:hypothetical protein
MAVQPQRGLTFEDVWAALMEDRERQKEADRQFQASKAEHDRMIAGHDRMIAGHDRMIAEMKESQKNLTHQMGGLHNSFGELAEHLVAPGIAEKFNALEYHFDSIAPGGKKILDEHGQALAQIDLLLENGEYSVAVEVKSKPNEDDVAEHVERLEILRLHMDKHHDTRIIRGAMAGAIFADSVKRASIKAGLYVIVQSGDTMNIETPAGFNPREW